MRLFYKTLLKYPREVGAILPSSNTLAKKVAAHVPIDLNRYVIELGAGTGVITKALLRRGVPYHRIIIVERSHDFVTILQKKFPSIHVIEGSAVNLTELLRNYLPNIGTIISGLPFRSLTQPVKNAIIKQLETLLQPGSRYIQYSYRIGQGDFDRKPQFKKISEQRVWRNVPPAKVEVFDIV